MLNSNMDIGERMKAEDARLETDQMFRAIVENSHAGIFTIDESFKIIYANGMTGQLLARPNDEIVGHDFREFLDEESVKIVAERYLRRQMGEDVPSRYEFNVVRKDGSKRRVEISSTIFRTPSGSLRTVGQVLDVTEQKEADEALKKANEEIQRVAAEERNRLARDLHDAVSQSLFSASLISEVLPRLWERDENEGRQRLEEVRQLTRGALAEMRTLLLELRPDSLVEADIDYLLKQLGESIAGRIRMPITVSITGKCALPVAVKLALYRIAQEALNNIAKHAAAKKAGVNLVCRPGNAVMEITDNGKGFDVNRGPANSFGLSIMKERAREIGALLSINSQVGRGTRVKVTWREGIP